MAKAEIKNLSGEKIADIDLKDEVFGLELNDNLVHQVYVSQAANQRQVLAHTKNISERAGSTRKPWKQKGTGRARTGSVRNPIWRKGGVLFGPLRNRNFSCKINKKMNQIAIMMVLSGKLRDKELVIVDNLDFQDNKTKKAVFAFEKLALKGRTLIALGKKEADKELATRNIKTVFNIAEDNLNVFDMLNTKYLLVSQSTLENIQARYVK